VGVWRALILRDKLPQSAPCASPIASACHVPDSLSVSVRRFSSAQEPGGIVFAASCG
jgi:hypothetical protein